jgi:hypothetical protein
VCVCVLSDRFEQLVEPIARRLNVPVLTLASPLFPPRDDIEPSFFDINMDRGAHIVYTRYGRTVSEWCCSRVMTDRAMTIARFQTQWYHGAAQGCVHDTPQRGGTGVSPGRRLGLEQGRPHSQCPSAPPRPRDHRCTSVRAQVSASRYLIV